MSLDGLKILFLGGDISNPTLILRMRSFLRAGCELISFTFRREKLNLDFQPEWENIPLGITVDRRYITRVPTLFKSIFLMRRHGDRFREVAAIYCRQIDHLLLGIVARRLTGSHAKLVYEVEDIQEVFFKKTICGWFYRLLERWALKRVDLLVLLSPGFLRGFFEPVQNYQGPHFILENKIQLGGQSADATEAGRQWEDITDRWVIGWFGTLRCP